MGVGDGIAVAVLAGVVDVDGKAGEALDHELAGEAGGCHEVPQAAMVIWVAARSSSGREVEVGQEDAAGIERDAAEGGVADGARLLVDLLEHEMLVTGFFGLDGIPGDAVRGEGVGVAVEVGEGDAGAGEDGELAVGEEVDVAGVVEDAGDVRGQEELAVADAEDGGRAEARGDELIGLVGGEDADGEGAGEALDGAADGFFERNDG